MKKEEYVALTAKQVHGSSGGQVHASRTRPGRCVWVSLTHTAPLPRPTVVMETKLAAVTHEAWFTQTALSFLRQENKNSLLSSNQCFIKLHN